jgi:hypothetical protein
MRTNQDDGRNARMRKEELTASVGQEYTKLSAVQAMQ